MKSLLVVYGNKGKEKMKNIDLNNNKNVIKYFCTLNFHLLDLISSWKILIERIGTTNIGIRSPNIRIDVDDAFAEHCLSHSLYNFTCKNPYSHKFYNFSNS